jgi:hypothetical protein
LLPKKGGFDGRTKCVSISRCLVPLRGHRGLRLAGPGAGNCIFHNDLPQFTGYGTARAPLYGMIHRLGTNSLWSFLRFAMPAILGLIVSASAAEAQRPVPAKPQTPAVQQSQSRQQIVPPGFFPPTGMCRIWINDVPAARQPAPTDCASAVRNRPANGRVLFGDDAPKTKKGKNDKSKSSPADELVDLITRRISK